MNFYEFNQNNSGGDFIVDSKLCHRLFIEAKNFDAAMEKAISLGAYFNGVDDGIDCECCGDRWSNYEYKLEFPMTYGVFKKEKVQEIVKKYKAKKYKVRYSLSKNKDYDLIFEDVESYAQYIANEYGWTVPDCRIFYNNGKVVEIVTNKNEE